MSSGSYEYDDEYPEGDHEIERQWQRGNWQEFVPQNQQQRQHVLPREFVPQHLQQHQQEFVPHVQHHQHEFVPRHHTQEFVPGQYHDEQQQPSFGQQHQFSSYNPAMAAAALKDNTFDPAMAAAALNDNTFYPGQQEHYEEEDDEEFYEEQLPSQYEQQQAYNDQQAMNYYGEYDVGRGYGGGMMSENNWMEIARLPDNASRFNAANSGVTAVAFDAEEELVWIGRGDGRMMALSTDGLESYCAFDGHLDVVRSICGVQNGAVSCSRHSLIASSRGGVFKGEVSLASSSNEQFRCCNAIDANTVVAAGTFKNLASVDVGISPATFSGGLQKKSVYSLPCGTGAMTTTGPAAGASSSGFVNPQQVCYVGGVDGRLRLVDFRTKRGIVSEFDVSPGKASVVSLATSGASVSCVSLFGQTVNDLRILDDSVEVAAASGRPKKVPAFELMVKIVDVRSKTRPVHSLAIPALEGTPSLVSLLKPPFVESSLSGTLAVARSRSHIVAVCDAGGDGSDARRLVSSAQKPVFFSGQHASAATLCMAASALSGQLLATGDANGTLVLWGSRPDARATAANPDEAKPSIERPPPESRFPKPPLDLDARAKRWPPNNASSPANAFVPAPENPDAALIVPPGADAPIEDIVPKMNLLSDEVRHVIEGEVMSRWAVDDSVPLQQQQKYSEGGDRRKGESAASIARRALKLEPKGAHRYTNRVVNPELATSKDMRRDGPLVGVPAPGDFKPNSLLHDPKAEEACYAVVDPRVASRVGDEKTNDDIPRKYARCFLDVSRRGVDGFNFSQFNSTPFGGLENSLQETSFTNAPILMLYFVPEIRQAILSEQYRESDKTGLILELSLLFDVLDAAPRLEKHRRACHSESVISALCQSPDAVALGLVTEFDRSSNQKHKTETRKQLASKACQFFKFVLDQIDINLSQRQGLSTDLFGLETVTTNEFIQGPASSNNSASATTAKKGAAGAGASRKVKTLTTEIQLEPPFLFRTQQKSNSLRLVDGVVSRVNASASSTKGTSAPAWTFSDALQSSLVRSTRARAWRESSRCYEPISQNRSPRPPLPSLLSLKCDIDSAEKGGAFCLDATWFPLEFQARVDCRGKCQVFEKKKNPDDEKESDSWVGAGDASLEDRGSDLATYDLVAVVSRVLWRGKEADEEGLVVHCRVGDEYYERAAGGEEEISTDSSRDKKRTRWLLVNDFLVEEENWRLPCSVLYRRRREQPAAPAPVSPARRVPRSVFETSSLSLSNASEKEKKVKSKTHAQQDRLPGEGDVVAFDSEFVLVATGEYAYNRDGSRVATTLGRQALARLSCVDFLERVVVDDYVLPTERIVDYKTRFSGINPEDLDPSKSRHHLVHRIHARMKLRYLIDAGCVIVGHSVTSDFRVLNLAIPKNLVDTVTLFYRPNERKLSLRFLSSRLLGQSIQSETHDSVEDARAALRLYKKYLELQESGTLRQTIDDLYNYGRSVDWAC